MIHPQYIVGIFDSGLGKFEIVKYKTCYKFKITIHGLNIKVLYKIKKRFKSGKVVIDKNILVITKQLTPILKFFYKNKCLTLKKSVEFYKFAYLYQKLIVEYNVVKTEKELRRINNKLHYFL